MIYEYLLTAFKIVVGLITTERLIYGALITIGFYLLWSCFALSGCFQKKFNRNCVKLYNFIKKNKLNAKDVNSVDFKAGKISSGFLHGWKKFKSSPTGKPSDFITRRDALDVEINGGVLNQGKSFMKSFINIATFVLFLFNFAYLGNNDLLSYYLIAEAMVLPFIFYIVCKILYFLHTSIKQQLYKSDIECLYELLDLLDAIFAKKSQVVLSSSEVGEFVQGEDAVVSTEGEELGFSDIVEEEQKPVEDEQVESPVEEEPEEEDFASKYDIFKKKNLDVDKILNEVPNESKTSLPFINVDSDYVIKDDDTPAVSKTISNLENGSALLGGMMQDMSSIKKSSQKETEEESSKQDDEEIKIEDDSAKNEESKSEDNKVEEIQEEAKEESKPEEISVDAFDGLGAFEVNENAPANESVEENKENETVLEESKPEDNKVDEIQEEQDDVKLEIPDVEPLDIEKPEIIEEPEEDVQEEEEISEAQRENIATVVGSFRPKSKLASGGVVIERNQPIARREKPTYQPQSKENFDQGLTTIDDVNQENFNYSAGITQLSAESNADNILNSFRNSAGGYDDYHGYNNIQGGMYGQGYGVPQYNQGYQSQPYGQPNYGAQNPAGYGVQGYQTAQTQGYNAYQNQNYEEELYEDEEDDFDDDVIEIEEETPEKIVKKAPVKRSKEDEPRPRNLKKKVSKPVMVEETKTTKRGRPKKQVFDETVTIKNDKEFDEVLSRAEKLMRKSEQGLSSSQSKRIEKELKMLMDAMNKYKEGV